MPNYYKKHFARDINNPERAIYKRELDRGVPHLFAVIDRREAGTSDRRTDRAAWDFIHAVKRHNNYTY
jgi:hypothetical protein